MLERTVLNKNVNFPICLAPMVGLSHVSMRKLLRRYLPKEAVTIWPTEMLNSRRIPNENFATTPETFKHTLDSQLVPQILGNDEKNISLSVQKLKHWGAEGIDINMGCPVQKALKHNYGVALMGDPNYASEVVAMTVRSSDMPVSVKLRAGLDSRENILLEFVKKLEFAGASWLTLHPRLGEEKRRGRADWSQIEFVRKHVSLPIIGNGDIQTFEDVDKMLNETKCDMVMVGRALTARPWLLWQWGEANGFSAPIDLSGVAPKDGYEEGEEYGRTLHFLLTDMYATFSPDYARRKFLFFVKNGANWLEFGHTLYAQVSKCKSVEETHLILEKFFSQPQKMFSRTELRQ